MFRMKARMSLSAMLLACWSCFLVSCSTINDRQEAITLRVMAVDDYQFNVLYKQPFEAVHPTIKLEPVILDTRYGVTYEEFKRVVETEKPDVLTLTPRTLQQMVEERQLLNLDPLIQRDGYRLDELHPPAVQYLRAKGQGSLFGLSSYANTAALFYNKDLFDQYDMPLPQDGMSWEMVLQLAQRFTELEDASDIRGLQLGGYLYGKGLFIMQMAKDMQIRYLDPSGKKVMINTAIWRELLRTAEKAFRSGAVTVQPSPDPDSFIAGKAAMTLGTPATALRLGNLDQKQARQQGKQNFEWKLVTAPAVQGGFYKGSWSIDSILSIASSSDYPEEAWSFIQFMNSKERIRSSGSLWSEQMQAIGGRSLEPFYKYPPKVDVHEDNIPRGFNVQFYMIVNEHFEQVLERKTSIEEALAAIQKEGQRKLDQIWQGLGGTEDAKTGAEEAP